MATKNIFEAVARQPRFSLIFTINTHIQNLLMWMQLSTSLIINEKISQYSTAVGEMSHNARRLGEVADWECRTMNNHLRAVARRHGGYHSYRYFAKPPVIRRTPRCR